MRRDICPSEDSNTFLNGSENKIINGCMRVAQRSTNTTGQLGYCVADRWHITGDAGDVLAISQAPVQDVTTFNPYHVLRIQRTAKLNEASSMALYQAIEMSNCFDLADQNVIVSFNCTSVLANSSANSVTLYYNDTLTEYGVTSSNWKVLEEKFFTVNSGQGFNKYGMVFKIPNNATQLRIRIKFDLPPVVGTNDTRHISNIQLKRGSVLTDFEYRDIGEELRLCQRYYQKFGGKSNSYQTIFASGYNLLGYVLFYNSLLPTPMRIPPTVTKYGTWYVFNCAQPIFSSDGVSLHGYSTYTATGGAVFENKTTDCYITLDAELV